MPYSEEAQMGNIAKQSVATNCEYEENAMGCGHISSLCDGLVPVDSIVYCAGTSIGLVVMRSNPSLPLCAIALDFINATW